jgi:hypothetical protein
MMLAILLARFTVGNSTGEPLLFKVFQASVIIRELTVEIIDCVP